MLNAKLELRILKEKAEKLYLNQMHNKNAPNGVNVSFKLQAKQHAKWGFKSELKLIESILTIGKELCKAAAIAAVYMVA